MPMELGDGNRYIRDFTEREVYVGGKTFPLGYMSVAVLNYGKEILEYLLWSIAPAYHAWQMLMARKWDMELFDTAVTHLRETHETLARLEPFCYFDNAVEADLLDAVFSGEMRDVLNDCYAIEERMTQYMNRYGLQGHFGDLKMTYVEALCAAMKTYPGGELPFLKYAGRKITAALHGYAMTNLKGFSDTAPTHFYQLRKAAHIYKSGSDSPVEAICTALHITEKTAIRLIEEVRALDTFSWLDAPLEDAEEVQIPDDSDAMRLSHPIRPEAALLQKEHREWLHNAFWRLDYQEQDVISRHLGFYKRCFCPTRVQTFEELADVYQLASAGSVMRRYRKAINKLRGFLKEIKIAELQIGTCNSDGPELTSHKSFWKGDVMNPIIELMKRHLEEHPPNFGDGDSVLTMLYECYNENNPFDSERILADFHALYEAMNGKTLREMDEIVYPVCTLCRDHERAGFVEGVKVGVLLAQEL